MCAGRAGCRKFPEAASSRSCAGEASQTVDGAISDSPVCLPRALNRRRKADLQKYCAARQPNERLFQPESDGAPCHPASSPIRVSGQAGQGCWPLTSRSTSERADSTSQELSRETGLKHQPPRPNVGLVAAGEVFLRTLLYPTRRRSNACRLWQRCARPPCLPLLWAGRTSARRFRGLNLKSLKPKPHAPSRRRWGFGGDQLQPAGRGGRPLRMARDSAETAFG
jgi:hypothetical protein